MAKRLVGVNIGGRGFQAVEIFTAMGELRIIRHLIKPLPEGFLSLLFNGSSPAEESGESGGPDLLAAFREELTDWFQPDMRVFSTVPPEHLFNRIISFPFSQPKKINQLIRFEAEGYFPFSLEDYLLEHFPSELHGRGAEVMAWAMEQDRLKQTLERFRMLGLDPVGLGVEGLCLSHLSMVNSNGLSSRPPGHSCHAYLDIGANRTLFLVVKANRPVLFRRLSFGGDQLEAALSKESGVPREDIQAGRLPETKKISAGLDKALEPLVLGITNTIHFHERFKEEDEDLPGRIREITLCGGSANLPGLASSLTEALEVPTRAYRIPQDLETEEDIPESVQPLLAEPLALAMQETLPSRSSVVNFRRGEFAYRSESITFKKKLILPVILLAGIILFSIVQVFAGRSQSLQDVKAIQRQMAEVLKKEIPGIAVVDPLRQIKQRLMDTQNRAVKYEDFTSSTALQVLSAVSENIPKEILVEVSRFEYTEARARLEGETSGFQEAKSAVDALSGVPFFEKVVLEDTRTGKDDKVRFVIQIPLKKEKISQ